MFGKRGNEDIGKSGSGAPPSAADDTPSAQPPAVLVEPVVEQRRASRWRHRRQTPQRRRPQRTEEYYDTKSQVFSALIDTIDLSQLSKLDSESAREEIRDIVNDIITIKNYRDVDLRAGRTARRHLQRRARLRSAGTAAGARRYRRYHGQRRRPDLHRSRRQDDRIRNSLPGQQPASVGLPAYRQPGRPPRRRIEPDLRRTPAGRLSRQRHRAAARHRRPGAHHP